LKALQFDTWVDRRKIEGGQNWMDVLDKAIDSCNVMLVVLSPDSERSNNVKKEYRAALHQEKIVIPLEYQPCSHVPFELRDIQWVDFKSNFAQGLRNLLIAIRSLLPEGDEQSQPVSHFTEVLSTSEVQLADSQKSQDPPKPNLDDIYQRGVVAREHGDLELAAALWQQVLEYDPNFRNDTLAPQLENLIKILRPDRIKRLFNQAMEAQRERKWREAAGSWQALLSLGLEEDMAKLAKDSLEFSLRAQGNEANKMGDWNQAIGSWQALLNLKPEDLQAKRQLDLAKHNQRYAQYYKDTQQYIDSGELSVAKSNLKQLWEELAPYYGDPEGFAATLGILETIRTPATFDSEEEARLERERQDKEAKIAQEQRKIQEQIEKLRKEEERSLIEKQRQLENKRKRKLEEWEQKKREAEEQARVEELRRQEWARIQELDRQRQAQAAAERARRLELERQAREARELVVRRTPTWFVKYDLEESRITVFYSLFALLGSFGIIVAFITKSLYWTLGIVTATAFIIYLLGFYRVIHPLPRRLQRPAGEGTPGKTTLYQDTDTDTLLVIVYIITFLLAVVVSCALAVAGVKLASPLNYNQQHTGTVLWVFKRNWLLSRQLALGLILGIVAGAIALFMSAAINEKDSKGMVIAKGTVWGVIIGVCIWLVVSLIAWLFNWGWGFGDGWGWGCMAFIIGIICIIALISTVIICAKGLTSR
jgi:hypothetical protein